MFVLVQLARRPTADLHRAQPLAGVEMPARVTAADPARQIREDHDGELEPLGLVHRHQPDAVAVFFKDRRFRAFGFSRLSQLVDEAAKRNAVGRLVLPRELRDVEHVGERLLASRPQDESHVRARRGQQPADRVGNRTVVTTPVEPLEQPERVGNRRQMRRRLGGECQLAPGIASELRGHAERMKRPEPVAEFEEIARPRLRTAIL